VFEDIGFAKSPQYGALVEFEMTTHKTAFI
jgi:hypothetical protein